MLVSLLNATREGRTEFAGVLLGMNMRKGLNTLKARKREERQKGRIFLIYDIVAFLHERAIRFAEHC